MELDMQFKIEQVAIAPTDPARAKQLLIDMGLADWIEDTVTAAGSVGDRLTANVANLSFNYMPLATNLEFEILDYIEGDNWIKGDVPTVSHLGMHVTAEELESWKEFFISRGIFIAQQVHTSRHTNQFLIDNGRKYNYCIFDTRRILGVDIKMIVRIE